MNARQFTNPNFGREVRVERQGREVRLIFVASTEEKAESLVDKIVSQLRGGALNLTMMGRPTKITET